MARDWPRLKTALDKPADRYHTPWTDTADDLAKWASWAESPALAGVHYRLLQSIHDAQLTALGSDGTPAHTAMAKMTGYRTLLQALAELSLPRGLMVDDLLRDLLSGEERLVAEEQIIAGLKARQDALAPPALGHKWSPPGDRIAELQATTRIRERALTDRLAWQREIHDRDVTDGPPDLQRAVKTIGLIRLLLTHYTPDLLREPPPIIDSKPSLRAMCHYVVRLGDTYWGIARRLLGDGKRAADIQAANARLTVLHPGDVLSVPWPSGEFVYVVPAGGTFWAAARAAYSTAANSEQVARIVAWNGGDPKRTLRIGEALYCPR